MKHPAETTPTNICAKKSYIPKTCIRKIDQFTSKYKTCQFLRSKSKFVVENIKSSPNPADDLQQCIHESVEEAIKDAVNYLGNATKVGVSISSVLLDQGDIDTAIIPINSNVIDAVWKRFHKIEESKSKTLNLYGEPFTITVTVLNTDGLPRNRRIKG